MRVYTVHEPPPQRYEQTQTGDPARFVFVRDGFSFWAFLFGPFWMLRHQMWLVLLGYAIVFVALELLLKLFGVSAGASFVAGLLLALLVGLEAPTLHRFTLGRRKWANVGVVVGDNLENAERRFFDGWVRSGGTAPSVTPVAPTPQPPSATPEVIGLFPQPEARR